MRALFTSSFILRINLFLITQLGILRSQQEPSAVGLLLSFSLQAVFASSDTSWDVCICQYPSTMVLYFIYMLLPFSATSGGFEPDLGGYIHHLFKIRHKIDEFWARIRFI